MSVEHHDLKFNTTYEYIHSYFKRKRNKSNLKNSVLKTSTRTSSRVFFWENSAPRIPDFYSLYDIWDGNLKEFDCKC